MLIYQIKKNAIVAFLDFVIEKSSAVKFSRLIILSKETVIIYYSSGQGLSFVPEFCRTMEGC